MSNVIAVNMNGLQLQINNNPSHAWFWDQISKSEWEQDTITLLNEKVDGDTLYIDIGTWIGPTVLCAGSRARRVVAVDPDAVAMTELMRNVDLNPEIGQKVSFHNHAISAQSGAIDLYAYNFGESMTSLVPTRGARKMTFLAMAVDDFLDKVLGDEPKVFIKVDIEGGEYDLIPALCAYLKERGVKADLYVSLHASFTVDEARTPSSWIANLEKNARVLGELVRYGTIHTYQDSQWMPLCDRPAADPAFYNFTDIAGLDTTIYVTAS